MSVGLFTCRCCNVSYQRELRGAPSFCEDCFFTHTVDRTVAMLMVRRAIQKGALQPVHTYKCDCGKPAKVYEHRDYTRPLDVTPACSGCNKRAGPAFNSVYRPSEAEPLSPN